MRDAIGQELTPSEPSRIVSLVPSLTETLFAYGAGNAVVGVTRYCVEPEAAVAPLLRIGGTKNPNIAAILTLAPDLVIASMEENRREDVEALVGAGLRVYVTLPQTVRAAVTLLADLARLIQAESRAAPLLAAIDEALAGAQTLCLGREPVAYFCPIWRRPYMTSGPGTYPYDILRVCGGRSVCGSGPARYFEVALADVAAAQPQVILLPDEPYPFAPRHVADFAGYVTVPAVRDGAIHCFDGKMLTWYGPRLPEALRALSRLLKAAAVRD